MVAKKKPAPDVYLMAVNQMGLDKSRCVVVEDSEIGLGAAKAAGISCIVTKSSYTANENFKGADMIVDELGDDPATGVTLETLAGLLKGGDTPGSTPSSGSPPAASATATTPPSTTTPPAPAKPTQRPSGETGPGKVKSDKQGLNPVWPQW